MSVAAARGGNSFAISMLQRSAQSMIMDTMTSL